jgi:hypothetical protein
MVTLVMLTVIVVTVGGRRLSIHMRRIVSMVMARIVLRLMHGWSMHMHVVEWGGVRGVVVHFAALHFFVLLLFVSVLHWMSTVVLIRFTFVVLLLFIRKLLPCSSDEACHGAAFGRNATVRLFQAKHMSRKEHVVARFVALAVCRLVRRLVLSHFFVIAFAIGFGTGKRVKECDC